MTVPAWSSPNGTTTGVAQAVTAANGSNTGSANVALYDPSNTAPTLYLQGDVGVTGTTSISAWIDLSGAGNDFTGVTDPSQGSGFNSGTHKYVAFNGSTQYGTFTLVGSPASATVCRTAQYTAVATGGSLYVPWFLGNTGGTYALYEQEAVTSGTAYWDIGLYATSAHITTPPADTAAHAGCWQAASGTYYLNIGGATPISGGAGTAPSYNTTNYLGAGAFSGVARFAPVNLEDIVIWPAGISGTDISTYIANRVTAYNVAVP
jgi:hypothetical protein